MQYIIQHEPMYALECRAFLDLDINGKSIRDEMEESIAFKSAEPIRTKVESLFNMALDIEDLFRNNFSFNLPGYEHSGQEIAEFLFKKWEGAENAPIDAVNNYGSEELLANEYKGVSIISTIDTAFMENNLWSAEDIDAKLMPPILDDSEFFAFIDNSALNQDDKLKALKLYYEYDLYRSYTKTLIEHATILLKSKLCDYVNEVNAHIAFLEEDFHNNNAKFLREALRFEPNDDHTYKIYPGIYCVNSFGIVAPAFIDPQLVIGVNCKPLWELTNNAESEKNKVEMFLKCMSDSTKQSILQLLSKEPLYGSQLAEKLNCTGANISQHMGALTVLDIVSMKKENNRIYFHLNREVIHKYFDMAKNLFG